MIEEQFVSFKTAKMLKEAGFRELTKTHYSNSGQIWETAMPADYNDDFNCNTCNRPTQALAARWLREEHQIFIMLTPVIQGWMYDLFDLKKHQYILCNEDAMTESYESAFETALREAIKLIKSKDYEKEIVESVG